MSLRDVGITLHDCEHKTPPACDGGYPYIAIPQLKEGRISFSEARRITQDHFVEWTRKAKPQFNDVILSRRCNPGETAHVPNGVDFALGQNLVMLRSDGTKVFRPFLRWLLRSSFWWDQVRKFINVGAVFDSLKCADIPSFLLPIPPIAEQKAIAHILGTLDDKIELNRRMNETLEATARALFKSWFVDFDPVRAKMDGQKPLGMDEETAKLFPDRFENSQLGKIPFGWRVVALSELCGVARGSSPRPIHDYLNGTVPWVKIADATRASGPFIFETKEFIKQHGVKNSVPLKSGALILSNSATCGVPIFLALDACIHDGWLYFKDLRDISKHYLYHALLALSEHLVHIADGSVQKNLNTKLIGSQALLVPPSEVVARFDSIVLPIFGLIHDNMSESRTLASLRDTVLPKLLSGEIRVADAEKLAEEVA